MGCIGIGKRMGSGKVRKFGLSYAASPRYNINKNFATTGASQESKVFESFFFVY